MKKLHLFSFFLFAIILFCICNNKNILKKINHQKENNNLDISSPKLAVISTTQEENQSILNFYDKNLNFIKTEELPYGALSDYMSLPASYRDSIYFIPAGVPFQKELELVLAYHPSSHSYQEYQIGMPGLLQVSASKNAIFTVNELNFISYISKFDKNTKKISRISSDEISYDTVYYYNGFLYATGKEHKEENAKQYIFQIEPNSMKILWKKEITKYGQGGLFFCGVKDELYFSLPYDSKERGNKSLMVLSLDNQKNLEEISLKESFPQQIKKLGDNLLILHSDLIAGEGDSISILNINTKESKRISLAHNILQMEVDEMSNSIYLLENEALYYYILNDKKDNLILKKKIQLEKQEKNNAYYYTGGFFLY